VISQIVEEIGVSRNQYALGCFDEPYLNTPDDLMLVKVLQPLREIGRRAVEIVLGRIDNRTSAGSEATTRILLPPEVLTVGHATTTGQTIGQ